MTSMSDLFDPVPNESRWGRRGDSHVWDAMREHVDGSPIPDTDGAVERILIDAFESLAMLPLPRLASERCDPIVRRRFPYGHRPLSEMPIDVDQWANDLIPLLVQRARAARRASA